MDGGLDDREVDIDGAAGTVVDAVGLGDGVVLSTIVSIGLALFFGIIKYLLNGYCSYNVKQKSIVNFIKAIKKRALARPSMLSKLYQTNVLNTRERRGASMNIREYLENYNELGDDIRRLNTELNRLLECREEIYDTLQAQVLSDMPKSEKEEGNDVVSKAAMITIELYSKSIYKLISHINYLQDQQDTFNEIWFKQGLLSNEEKRIIDIRFFQKTDSFGKKLTWDDIACITSYCKEQCMRKSEKGIFKMQNEVDLKKNKAI